MFVGMLTTLDVALSQVGIQEETGHNDGIPAARYMRGDPLAWCAGFVLWCNEHSDDPRIARSLGEHYAMRKASEMCARLRKRGWGVTPSATTVRPNDLAFFYGRAGSDPGSIGTVSHVAVVLEVTETHLHTVDGNYSNRVEIVKRAWSKRELAAVMRMT